MKNGIMARNPIANVQGASFTCVVATCMNLSFACILKLCLNPLLRYEYDKTTLAIGFRRRYSLGRLYDVWTIKRSYEKGPR